MICDYVVYGVCCKKGSTCEGRDCMYLDYRACKHATFGVYDCRFLSSVYSKSLCTYSDRYVDNSTYFRHRTHRRPLLKSKR